MKTRFHACFTGIVLCFIGPWGTLRAAEIMVHAAGQVKKPGMHKLESPVAPKDLEKACGGWGEFGNPRRMQVIRLARPSSPTVNDPGEKRSQVFELADIPKKDGKYLLKANDIIYIPMKVVYGR